MELPYDEWTHVMSFLELRDLATICLVNKCLGWAAKSLYLDPSIGNRGIRICAELGYEIALKSLLEDPRTDPRAICDDYTIYLPNLESYIPGDFLDSIYNWLISPTTSDYPIRAATLRGYHGLVKMFLEDGRSDPNSFNGFCLWTACHNGDIDMVSILLRDPRTAITNGCLLSTAVAKRLDILRLLLAQVNDLTELIISERISLDEDIVSLLRTKGWRG
jgi:hypothetical protein